ncbi:protein FAM135B-like isoform X2 [Mangifera indica]|uniref:protein FAM135B-like isoform X2 n=1 Tax=Mangifera indica TaxID=29780 RepID=UPI001CF9C44D|nr:protein FAM135B-like isoform X2 [Mangifera indica]
MFRKLKWFTPFSHRNWSIKRLPNANNHFPNPKSPASPLSSASTPTAVIDVTIDTLYEIAIYIHRFHNLDLFQQGWYQIKISLRWEDSEVMGIPARVVQFEAPEPGPEGTSGVWRIDDTENSFWTQPFWIRYARQDVYLSVMIAFNLADSRHEGPSTSAVILKFELMYAPRLENGLELLSSLGACPAAVHEFRIPPKALLGLHSYCPVHFDALHTVLVDVTVHISLLKASSSTASLKSDFKTQEAWGQLASVGRKQVMFVKALITAYEILLGDLQRISEAIDHAIDLTDCTFKLDDTKLFGCVDCTVLGQLSGMQQNGVEKAEGKTDLNDELSDSISWGDLLNAFQILGNQILSLWNTFLMFHREFNLIKRVGKGWSVVDNSSLNTRANRAKVMEFLCDTWANDRKAEWSIWMMYSKAEVPSHLLSTGLDESSYRAFRAKALSMQKYSVSEDPAQSAAMRAELHRRSIAQMRDMHIFGDPLHIPIVMVERCTSAPLCTTSGNLYFSQLDQRDKHGFLVRPSIKAVEKSIGASSQPAGHVLKIVVFVHGFQGHHLDLRLVRNQWLLIDPKIEFLMSEVNEDKTDGDFREMGLRLAEEVISFLKKKMDKVSRSGNLRDIKLSFVGHSIGNVIIRSALTESKMEPYLRFLYTYVSISGPHLGYLYSSNSLFNSGLWLLKKLRGTQCIHQLTFSDDPDLQNTFFYNLCKHRTLEFFKNILLLSSPQDGYVPYHSARIEMAQASLWDNSKKRAIFLEMLNDCLEQMYAPSSEHRVFMRFDINFDTSSQGRNLNTLIGRAAHIEFLESDIFAKFIMWSFPELFR